MGSIMPAKSKAQSRFMFAETAKKKAGKKGDTDMSMAQLKDFTKTKQKGLPEKVKDTVGSGKIKKAKKGKK